MDEGYRIGDAERDHVRSLLELHTSAGRLTLDEFEERLEQVYAARTGAALDRALVELPPVPAQLLPAAAAQLRARRRRQARVAVPLAVAVVLVLALMVASGSFFPFWVLFFIGPHLWRRSQRAQQHSLRGVAGGAAPHERRPRHGGWRDDGGVRWV